MFESCTLKTRVQNHKRSRLLWGQIPFNLLIKYSHFYSGEGKKKKEMAKIKKMLQSDLKITVIRLRQ